MPQRLIAVDRDRDFARIPKLSAYAFGRVATTGRLDTLRDELVKASFALLQSLGQNAHRLSLEWSRIEPAPGEFSRSALGHYRRVLTALATSGMTGFVTLHHFTLPRWFAARGGWLAPDAVELFERYCRQVAAELGDLMPFVCTINEPQMVALHGYLEGYHPPGQTNAIAWKRVGRVLLSAHQAAVRAMRDGPGAPPRTGLILQLPLLAPARDDDVCRSFLQHLRGEMVRSSELPAPCGGCWRAKRCCCRWWHPARHRDRRRFACVGYETFVKRALSQATMQLPWPPLGVVVLIAALAGLLASVLPARRAARVRPAAGLPLD